MRAGTVRRLAELNREFYETFGGAFAATRRRIQPGVRAFLATVRDGSEWLDLGCGSGALAAEWARLGIRGGYSGRDFSSALLSEARALTAGLSTNSFRIDYGELDLLDPGWADAFGERRFDGVACFAALHHIPGRAAQAAVFANAARLLRPGGEAIFSVWQFQNSPKLAARALPWSTIGLSEGDVEPGDTLLDWRYALPGSNDAVGLRYVHLFSEASLAALAWEAGLTLESTFYSDGKSGDLALYQRYRKIEANLSDNKS